MIIMVYLAKGRHAHPGRRRATHPTNQDPVCLNQLQPRSFSACCWAHARRKFFDARLSQPREVHYILGLIAQLYDIEDEIRPANPNERLAARQKRCVPILDRLESFLREQQAEALPKSQYGKAIAYTLND